MLSRRIIRIKVLQILYAHFKSVNATIQMSEKQLFHSLEKSYDLYLSIILFILEIQKLAENKIAMARQKKIPTYDDLNPNTKFINNRILQGLKNSDKYQRLLEKRKVSWVNYPELTKNFFNYLLSTECYNNYMNIDEDSFQLDKKFIVQLYKKELLYFEPLYQNLEEQSIYWNDEIDFVINMVCKTIENHYEKQKDGIKLMTLFKNDEDKEFTKKLFRKAILRTSEYRELIKKFTKNWELDRIAFMDVLLIQLALAEITEFQSIPVKVSFNEYIEISKFYSTRKSSVFLNGLLDKIIKHLKETGKIVKTGRGLIGEI